MKDARHEVALAFKELLILYIELIFGTLHLGVILYPQVGKVAVGRGTVGHGVEDFAETEVSELHLCASHERHGDDKKRQEKLFHNVRFFK